MYWLAINREPVTAAQLKADIIPSVSAVELRDVLVSLDRRSLIEKIKLTSTKPITEMKLDCVRYTQQPVVMEYVTEQLVERVCREVEQAQIACLRSHALLKTQAKENVPGMQMQQIVQPILTRLLKVQGGSENLKQLLKVQPSAKTYFLASAGIIRTIWLWDIQSGYLPIFAYIPLRILATAFRVIEPEVNWISSAAFSPSKPCLGNEDKTVKLQTWASISFQSQRNLLINSSFEWTLNLWDLQTGIAIVALQIPTSPIRSIAFDPEGRLLVSRGATST